MEEAKATRGFTRFLKSNTLPPRRRRAKQLTISTRERTYLQQLQCDGLYCVLTMLCDHKFPDGPISDPLSSSSDSGSPSFSASSSFESNSDDDSDSPAPRETRRVSSDKKSPAKPKAVPKSVTLPKVFVVSRNSAWFGSATDDAGASDYHAIKDPFVSKRHFKIFEDGARYWLLDEGSTNGTLLRRFNDAPQAPRSFPLPPCYPLPPSSFAPGCFPPNAALLPDASPSVAVPDALLANGGSAGGRRILQNTTFLFGKAELYVKTVVDADQRQEAEPAGAAERKVEVSGCYIEVQFTSWATETGPTKSRPTFSKELRVTSAGTLIGKGAHCAVQLIDQDLAEEQARITCVDGKFYMVDVDAQHPYRFFTRLTPNRPERLENGDTIRVGTTDILVEIRALPLSIPPPPCPLLTRSSASLPGSPQRTVPASHAAAHLCLTEPRPRPLQSLSPSPLSSSTFDLSLTSIQPVRLAPSFSVDTLELSTPSTGSRSAALQHSSSLGAAPESGRLPMSPPPAPSGDAALPTLTTPPAANSQRTMQTDVRRKSVRPQLTPNLMVSPFNAPPSRGASTLTAQLFVPLPEGDRPETSETDADTEESESELGLPPSVAPRVVPKGNGAHWQNVLQLSPLLATPLTQPELLNHNACPKIATKTRLPITCAQDIGFEMDGNFSVPNNVEMQDRVVTVDGFAGRVWAGFFAVFDGHQDRRVADFAASALYTNLLDEIESMHRDSAERTRCTTTEAGSVTDSGPSPRGFDMKEALRRAFRHTASQIEGLGDVAKFGGTTAVTCVLWKDEQTNTMKLYTANLGDSRAVLLRRSGTQGSVSCRESSSSVCTEAPASTPHSSSPSSPVLSSTPSSSSLLPEDQHDIGPAAFRPSVVALTYEHLAADKQEQARVLQAGGKITRHGDAYRLGMCLDVTRAFGDLGLLPYGLSSEPHITEMTLGPQDAYVVLSSDGLSDVLSDDEILNLVLGQEQEALRFIHRDQVDAHDDGDSTASKNCEWLSKLPSAHALSRYLIDCALRRSAHDNLAVVVVRLTGPDLHNDSLEVPTDKPATTVSSALPLLSMFIDPGETVSHGQKGAASVPPRAVSASSASPSASASAPPSLVLSRSSQ